ncbi:protein MEI2-like 6 [Mercurialis annua]|uniref:protein MEI2-like 6 n=1 Tax=Mercurialis annua TaxID=3986 RepID=UPI00215E6CB9|nr:protein MEI2-like 6 [Mercurialis annua]
MCNYPSSPSMASSSRTSKPKPLDPNAQPFLRQHKTFPPKSVFLPPVPFFPHQHHQLRLPQVVQPVMAPGSHGVVCYPPPPPPPQWYRQSPSWVYPPPPPPPPPTVFYNRQPLPIANPVPCYVPAVTERNSNTTPQAVGGARKMADGVKHVNDFRVRGGYENNWALKNKSKGPRMMVKKTQTSWVRKDSAACNSKSIKRRGYHPEIKEKTSIMIRNIPNQFQRRHLIRILDEHCVKENKKAKLMSDPEQSMFDFVYLPMDFGSGANLGYAFVNFTNSAGATRFFKSFQNFKWEVSVNKKICEICYAALQGKCTLIKHFRNSVFPCMSYEFLPVYFSSPRDGFAKPSPVIIGRRINPGSAIAVSISGVNWKHGIEVQHILLMNKCCVLVIWLCLHFKLVDGFVLFVIDYITTSSF